MQLLFLKPDEAGFMFDYCMQCSVFECLIMFDCLSVQFLNVRLSLIGKILGWLSSITKPNQTIEWLEFDWVWLQNVWLTMPGIWESNLPWRFVAVTDCSLPFVTSTAATNHQRTPSMYVSRKFTLYISRDFKNVAHCWFFVLFINWNFKFWYDYPPGGEGVPPYVGYIGMCRCGGYGFQAVYSRIGYINQGVWV